MSTWTSRPPAAAWTGGALAAALTLAGCVAGQGGTGSVQVGRDGPMIAAPAGFCAARDAATSLGEAAFAAFTSCSGSGGPVLTATLGPPGSAEGADLDPAALVPLLISDRGRGLLSRSGKAAAVRIHEVTGEPGTVLVRLTDSSPADALKTSGESWRALLAVQGRLATLSVTGGRDAPLTADVGRRLIDRFVASVRAANQLRAAAP